MPYDVTSTGITQGDFEADDDDFVEYAEEFTFPVGRLFDEQLIAGGWVELRRDDDGVTITAFFGVARNGDWKNKRILPEDTAVQGHYDFENKTWEFWIDQEAVPDERRFFIDNLLIKWRLMKNGFSYTAATDLANEKEQAERRKTRDYQEALKEEGDDLVRKLHCRLLKKIAPDLSVWLVNGRLVRSLFKVDFTEGGHDLVYRFIPKREIWLDNDVLAMERSCIILHELYERRLMSQGLSYFQAHRRASRLEWRSRMNKKRLKENLKKLDWE